MECWEELLEDLDGSDKKSFWKSLETEKSNKREVHRREMRREVGSCPSPEDAYSEMEVDDGSDDADLERCTLQPITLLDVGFQIADMAPRLCPQALASGKAGCCQRFPQLPKVAARLAASGHPHFSDPGLVLPTA